MRCYKVKHTHLKIPTNNVKPYPTICFDFLLVPFNSTFIKNQHRAQEFTKNKKSNILLVIL